MAEPLRGRCRHAGEGPECRRCPHGVPGHGQLLPQLNLLLRLLLLIACLRAMPPCPALPWCLREVVLGPSHPGEVSEGEAVRHVTCQPMQGREGWGDMPQT